MSNNSGHMLSRAKLLLMMGLLVLSTVLFVAGIALERSATASAARAPAPQPTVAAQVGQGAQESTAAREAQERQEAAPAVPQSGTEGTAAHEQTEQNRVFGIDVESPWVIAGIVLGTLLLVLFVAVVATIFDGREVVYQLGQARYGVAALALGVVASRLATAIVAGLALREGRRSAHPPVTPSRSVVP
jgi:hypothetical protein